jgi:hypothetical protein
MRPRGEAVTLEDALDDCVSGLMDGTSVEVCLATYPQHADTLRPLLETANRLRQVEQPVADAAAVSRGKRAMMRALADKRKRIKEARPSDTAWALKGVRG